MKKAGKIVALIACVCLVLGVFAGCSGDTPTPTTTPTNSPKADGDVIVMGTNAEFPPFEYVTDQGIVDKFSGIDVAIAKEIADNMGKTLKVENMEFDSLITALATGKVDFVAAGMTIRPDRQENVDFSDTYYSAKQVMIVKEGSDIKSAADLKDKKIGVVLGYTGDTTVTEDLGYTPERFKKGADAVLDLVNGRIDVVVIDSAPAKAFVEKNPGLAIVEDAEAFEQEEYAIAVQKGDKELLEKVNKVLGELKDSGKIEEFGATYSE